MSLCGALRGALRQGGVLVVCVVAEVSAGMGGGRGNCLRPVQQSALARLASHECSMNAVHFGPVARGEDT